MEVRTTNAEDEIEISELLVDLPEGADPMLGEDVAQEVLRRLRGLIEEL